MRTGTKIGGGNERLEPGALERAIPPPPEPIDRRDLPWISFLAGSLAFGIIFTWGRWVDPFVDCGREMNQPLRLLQGEQLYSQIRHIYGPLSPYINFALYRVFGPSLGVLYAGGIVATTIILALVYWLSRQLMGRAASTVATFGVTWMCALKPGAGNFILPYAYGSVHACLLGFATLALLVRFIRGERSWQLFAAGVLAGAAVLAKTEMGLAPLSAGLLTAVLKGYPRGRRMLALLGTFLLPAIGIPTVVYARIATHVGWYTLSQDNLLFTTNLPPALVYFNKKMFGFDHPLRSLLHMADSALQMLWLAALIAGLCHWLARRRQSANASTENGAATLDSRRWWLIILLLTGLVGVAAWLAGKTDEGPFLAMPFFLLAALVYLLIGFPRRREGAPASQQWLILSVTVIFALASLARMLLRVRSGGTYAAYALPASVILFVYGWTYLFAGQFRDARMRRYAYRITLAALFTPTLVIAFNLSRFYRRDISYRVTTARGTMWMRPDVGQTFDAAIRLVERETSPGEFVAILPEGTSLLFLTNRRNPLREEVVTPGYLDGENEERAIRQLEDTNTRLVLVARRRTAEFGPAEFGRDYDQKLMRWIEDHFKLDAVLSTEPNPERLAASNAFFIRVYRKKPVSLSGGTSSALEAFATICRLHLRLRDRWRRTDRNLEDRYILPEGSMWQAPEFRKLRCQLGVEVR